MLAPSRDLWYGTSGPRDAEIVLVGESWGKEELDQCKPFVGQSGKELDRILAEGGIARDSCFATNVLPVHPPGNDPEWDPRLFHTNEKGRQKWRGLHPTEFTISEVNRLHQQIESIKPRVVIAAGNYALWALTDSASISSTSNGRGVTVLVPGGIMSWRGSMLDSPRGKVLPIIHPAAIMRQWYLRAVTVHDLRTRVPMALRNMWRPSSPPTMLAPPSYEQSIGLLRSWLLQMDGGLRLRLSHDIETARGLITCMGFATGPFDASGEALVVPFVRLIGARRFDSYWTPSQEASLVHAIRRVLVHPNVEIEGQNYIYDTQYVQHFFGITPRLSFDTMLAHHLLFPGTPKGLDYLSSLYCKFHWYWKDDNKDWDTSLDERQHLEYNAVDVLRTYECATVLRQLIIDHNMSEQWEWEKRKNALALSMMNRGVLIDKERRSSMAFTELLPQIQELERRLASIVPESLAKGALKDDSKSKPWYNSNKKQQHIFYEALGLPRQTHRKTGRTSVDDEALRALKAKVPELGRLFDLILEARSLGVFYSTFVSAPLDPDGRMRCSFNPAGTETFRWSSSKNAFGRGTNLQNIPKGDEE